MNIFTRAWRQQELAPIERSLLKVFWTLVRGALYVGVSTAVMYVANYHPTTADVPLAVGLAAGAESLIVGVGKWITATYGSALGQPIQNSAPAIAADILQLGRVNDPHIPLVIPPLPSGGDTIPVPPDPAPVSGT